MSDLVPIDLPKPSLTEVIAQAARDPATDVAKMEKLLAMYERIEATNAERAFNEAMNASQEEMAPIRTDASNSQTKSKYASYPALDRIMRPIYTSQGFSLSFDTGDAPLEGHVRVLCYVGHRSGHSRTYRIDMPADGKGAKGGDVMSRTHAVGSAASYGQRYLLLMIFNIAVTRDDDGNAAGGSVEGLQPITEVQVMTIQTLIADYKADIEKLCKYFNVASLSEIKARDYKRVIEALHQKAKSTK